MADTVLNDTDDAATVAELDAREVGSEGASYSRPAITSRERITGLLFNPSRSDKEGP